MKAIYKIIFTILLCTGYTITAIAQNLNSMPEAQRDSLLISVAKEAVLKLGPDYYREYKQPVVSYQQSPIDPYINRPDRDNTCYYIITFPYDPAVEQLEYDFAARVCIYEDTGDLESVLFGCGTGKGRYRMYGIDWRNDTSIVPVPYQERPIAPEYPFIEFHQPWSPITQEREDELLIKLNEGRHPDNPVVIIPSSLLGNQEQIDEFQKKVIAQSREVPLNLDELLRRGYERQSDGTWVKTRPDVPPHKRNQ